MNKLSYLFRNIRYLRSKAGWSQEQLADILGYKSYSTIQKWESGVSEPPLKVLCELAEMFHTDIDTLAKVDMCRLGAKRIKIKRRSSTNYSHKKFQQAKLEMPSRIEFWLEQDDSSKTVTVANQNGRVEFSKKQIPILIAELTHLNRSK